MSAPEPLPPRPAEALKVRLARLSIDPRVHLVPELRGLLDDFRRFVIQFENLEARLHALESSEKCGYGD